MNESCGLPELNEGARPGWSYLASDGSDCGFTASLETIDNYLTHMAILHPERAAISWLDGESVRESSWSELYERATRIGGAIRNRAPSARRIGILGRDRVAWISAMYGAARADCSIVPMPYGEPFDALAARCDQVPVDLLVTVGNVSVGGDLVGPEVIGIEDLEAEGGALPDDRDRSRADDAFLLQFTSGTTGRPKVAVLSHRALLGSARHYAVAAGATDGTIFYNPLPLDHVGGTVGGVLASLSVGGTYTATERFDPRSTIEVLRRLRPQIVGLVPTMVVDILAVEGVGPEDFASVEVIVGGATNVDPGLIDSIENRLNTRFLVAYGQSEAPCLTMSSADDPPYERTRTIGRPLPDRDYCVMDGGRLVEEGAVGELCVRGPLIMSGYLGDDGRIVPACDRHGWMRTGDLCSMSRGIITFHSRLRDVVIRGGENLYPAEIEGVLAEIDGIREVVVFGLPDPRLGELPAAAVLPTPGSMLAEADLEAFACARLARKKRPVRWFVVDEFPRTSTGKVRRFDLAAQLTPGTT